MQQRLSGRVSVEPISIVPDRQVGLLHKPLLICFSHLRWDFVWQRPQHLLTRAARMFDVVFMEEPVYRTDVAAHLEVSARDGIRVAIPILPHGATALEATMAQRQMLERFIAGESSRIRLFW
jgi:hypothetical protein